MSDKREIEGKELPKAKKVKDSRGVENTTTKTPPIEVKSPSEKKELKMPDMTSMLDILTKGDLKRQKEFLKNEKDLASNELELRTYGQSLQMRVNGSFTKICQEKFMEAMTYLRTSEDRKETKNNTIPFDLTYQTRWNEKDLPPDSFACRAFLLGLSMADAMLENPFVLGKYHLQDDETFIKSLEGLNRIPPIPSLTSDILLELKKHLSTPPKVVIAVIPLDNINATPFACYDQKTGIISISKTVCIPY
jgi:hypothetical protein